MKTACSYLFVIIAALSLAASPAMAHHDDYNLFNSNSHGKITTENGKVIIHADDGSTARIAPDGNLVIDGKTRSVNPAQRQMLVQYVATVTHIEHQGLQLASAAPGFAASVTADVLAGLFGGESDDQIDKKAENRASGFKQKALSICRDVQNLKHTQDALTVGIPTFKPYAVIESADNCKRDIHTDD